MNNSDFLVSVIIPVYNVENYLHKCLESVIGQSYKNLEIIIVDDGSSDGSGRICDEFSLIDDRIIVLHTKNKGLAAARNLGLETAKGIYFLFVDSDDWIDHNTIKILLEASIKYNADIVSAGHCYEYVNCSVHSKKAYKNQTNLYQGDNILKAYADGIIRSVVWNKLYHRNCFSNIVFPDGHNYEDAAITWKIMKELSRKKARIVVLSKELFHFRMRKSSITHTKSLNNIIDCWDANVEKYQGLSDYKDKMIPYCFIAIWLMWINYPRFSRSEKLRAKNVVESMVHFSKTHFRQIVGKKYSFQTKAICLLSQRKPSFLMLIVFYAQQFFGELRGYLKKKFD